jgi:hypothetical protein
MHESPVRRAAPQHPEVDVNGSNGPFPAHWFEDFTFLTMSLEKMPWRNWKGLES